MTCFKNSAGLKISGQNERTGGQMILFVSVKRKRHHGAVIDVQGDFRNR